MLVVTRKTDEGIVISENIEITVLEITKERVKLGISAPKEIGIVRRELVDAQNENCEASKEIPKSALEAFLNMKK